MSEELSDEDEEVLFLATLVFTVLSGGGLDRMRGSLSDAGVEDAELESAVATALVSLS